MSVRAVTAPQVAVTAVVCTRNRGAAIAAALHSLLANMPAQFELLIVDQSTSDDTQHAVAPFVADPRVRYVRSATVGLGRARNIGLRLAQTEVVAFTDDDCEVPPDWLAQMSRSFSEHPRVAVTFCSVTAGPHDVHAGFVPVYRCQGTRVLRRIGEKPRARGIGAGMAVRRRAMVELGGFDEELGAGATFPSWEDGDVASRALLGGYEVCETDRTAVVHFGFRSWEEGRRLSRRDWVGIGAGCAKPLRAGRWRFAAVALYELCACALWPGIRDVLRFKWPSGLGRAFYFAEGFVRGLGAPFDRKLLVFRSHTS